MASLSAEIARNYFEFREEQARRRLLLRSFANEDLALYRRQADSGLANESNQTRAASQVASVRAQLHEIEGEAGLSLLSSAPLTGDTAGDLATEFGDAEALPSITEPVPGGLLSELLKRRPDIRKAYAQLTASSARLKSAQVTGSRPPTPHEGVRRGRPTVPGRTPARATSAGSVPRRGSLWNST